MRGCDDGGRGVRGGHTGPRRVFCELGSGTGEGCCKEEAPVVEMQVRVSFAAGGMSELPRGTGRLGGTSGVRVMRGGVVIAGLDLGGAVARVRMGSDVLPLPA